MKGMLGKRVVAVTVRMSEEDDAKFKQCAARVWPGAVMSQSAVLLSLARWACERMNRKRDKKKKASE